MDAHEPTFFANSGPRYHHVDAGTGAHEMAAKLGGTSATSNKEAGNWRKGAIGEEEVGRHLDALPRPWAVVHDLTIGSRGANLDHLVLGPPRVFTLNTKHLSGDVTVYGRALFVGGQKTAYLPRAVEEAAKVREALGRATGIDALVWPVLVFHGCRVRIKETPTDVTVLTTEQLQSWFTSMRDRNLSPAGLMTLQTAARSPSTWPTPRPAAPPPREPATTAAPAPVASPAEPTFSTRPWRRFGHDRLYVNLGDETLGYLDNQTGTIHVEREQDRTLVESFLAATGHRD